MTAEPTPPPKITQAEITHGQPFTIWTSPVRDSCSVFRAEEHREWVIVPNLLLGYHQIRVNHTSRAFPKKPSRIFYTHPKTFAAVKCYPQRHD